MHKDAGNGQIKKGSVKNLKRLQTKALNWLARLFDLIDSSEAYFALPQIDLMLLFFDALVYYI